MKRIVILQPGYLPWLGFFDLMFKADVFVILDDVQYTKRDWRSRNRIKTTDGVIWLTVPVRAKGSRDKRIKDIEIDNAQDWARKHIRSIATFYKSARFYGEVMPVIERIYKKEFKYLIDLDLALTFEICQFLSLEREIVFSSKLGTESSKDDKLLSICMRLGGTHYLSGNAAKGYLRERIFEEDRISVEWHNYVHPYYRQLWVEKVGFVSHLSAIDLLLNHGRESLEILTGKKVIKPEGRINVIHADDLKGK
jgi:hypothetical protein